MSSDTFPPPLLGGSFKNVRGEIDTATVDDVRVALSCYVTANEILAGPQMWDVALQHLGRAS